MSKDYPINEESLAQTDDDIFKIAQVLVNLAVATVNHDPTAYLMAIDALYHYADWRNIDLPVIVKRALKIKSVKEGGEEDDIEGPIC